MPFDKSAEFIHNFRSASQVSLLLLGIYANGDMVLAVLLCILKSLQVVTPLTYLFYLLATVLKTAINKLNN